MLRQLLEKKCVRHPQNLLLFFDRFQFLLAPISFTISSSKLVVGAQFSLQMKSDVRFTPCHTYLETGKKMGSPQQKKWSIKMPSIISTRMS